MNKLEYITLLNGKCPEGYEVEKFMAGGKPCMKCKKKAAQKMKQGSVLDSIRAELKQKGGKYNEAEHAKLLEKLNKGQIKDKSPEAVRLQELNRTSGHHEDGWKPSKLNKKK